MHFLYTFLLKPLFIICIGSHTRQALPNHCMIPRIPSNTCGIFMQNLIPSSMHFLATHTLLHSLLLLNTFTLLVREFADTKSELGGWYSLLRYTQSGRFSSSVGSHEAWYKKSRTCILCCLLTMLLNKHRETHTKLVTRK